MKKIFCALTLSTLCLIAAANAQVTSDAQATVAKQQFVGAINAATTTCSFNFSNVTATQFIKFCVTNNGNIVSFESPSGHQYLSHAPIGEGYGLCNFDTSTAYTDYAGFGDSGWQAPSSVTSTATNVKVVRTTTDGIFTLTQTILINKGQNTAQVTMTIKNNTTTARHIGLLRYADVDVDNATGNSFDFTQHTAFGYNQSGAGLQLQFVNGALLNGGFTQDIPGGPNPCQIFAHSAGPLANTDGSVVMQDDIQLASKVAKTIVLAYKAF